MFVSGQNPDSPVRPVANIGGFAECRTIAADLLSSTYKDNIEAFNNQFQKAQKILEGTLQMDQYQLVASIGSSLPRGCQHLVIHCSQPRTRLCRNLVRSPRHTGNLAQGVLRVPG